MSRELVALLEMGARKPTPEKPAAEPAPKKPAPSVEPAPAKPKRKRKPRAKTDAELRALLKRWAWGDPPLLPEK